jgi:hypothetical protein
MNEFDLFNEIGLAGVLKEYHDPEKFYYINNNRLYVDGLNPAQLIRNHTQYISKDVLISINPFLSKINIYKISQDRSNVKLHLSYETKFPVSNTYGYNFINNLLYFMYPGQKNIGIFNVVTNTFEAIPIDYGRDHIRKIMVSNGNIVLESRSEYSTSVSLETILKDGTLKTTGKIRDPSSHLFNNILYLYDNSTQNLTYFNIYEPEKKVTMNMKRNDVEDLIITSKCTILVCKYSLIIYYKEQVIVLNGKDYFLKEDKYQRRDDGHDGPAEGYRFLRSVALNKDSNKIVFCVFEKELWRNSPVVVYNLNTQQVETEIGFNNQTPSATLGFIDIFE